MIELTDDILTKVIAKRPVASHKGDYGRVLVVGGNAQYGGAAILAASSAVYAGAGLVTAATDRVNRTALHARLPEAMVLDWQSDLGNTVEKSDIVLIGCGLGETAESLSVLTKVLSAVTARQFLVVDGSAITLFAAYQLTAPFPARTVFTPHQMELERLSGLLIKEQSPEKIQEFVTRMGTIVVAKSHETKVFGPDSASEPYLLTIGTPAQATGGMGDTLAGLVAAFLGQFKTDPLASIAAAVYLHSKIAQELAMKNYVVLPSRLIQAIPQLMKKYEN